MIFINILSKVNKWFMYQSLKLGLSLSDLYRSVLKTSFYFVLVNLLRHIRLLTVLLLSGMMAVAIANVASASESDVNSSYGVYTVTSASGHTSFNQYRTISSSITQGQTNWHYQNINGYYTSLNVDLNWGYSANSLQLTIYSPDGYVFGPFYDIDDGVSDGRINLYINNPNGIAQGNWGYRVYGYSVSGTESYTI